MSFWGELRRRNVVKAGTAYLVVAWLLAQVVGLVLPTFNAPAWVGQTIIFLLMLGFPIVLVVAWAFEITPDGIKATASVPRSESITPVTGQKLNYAIIGLLVLAVAFMFVDNYVLDDSAQDASARATGAPAETPATDVPGSTTADEETGVLPNSIAVLPFENLSPDADDAYFAGGLHEEVLNQLSKLSNLSVISRTSVLRYAGAQRSIPDIARELNVGTIMEGSVRYAGNRIRVTTQLIDAATDQHLWSETYDREFDDIFAIESDIAMNVANALQAEFSPAEQAAIEQVPTASPAAYALYLQARNTLGSSNAVGLIHALLDRALAIDPRFADALGFKAQIYAGTFVNSTQSTGVEAEGRAALERQVRDYAERAFAIDPGNAHARAALRGINLVTWRWSAYEEAVAPGDEDGFVGPQLWVYAWMGKRAEAVRIAARGVELNPTTAGAYMFLGVVQAYAGDLDASMRSLDRGHVHDPAEPLIQAWKVYNEIARGNVDEAAAALDLLERMLGNNRPIIYLPELAYSYSRIGRREDAERYFAEIEALDNPAGFGAGGMAAAYLAIGDEARALEQLERVAEKARNHEPDAGYINVMNLKMNYLADPTLEKPEFVDVLSRIAGD